MSRRIFSTPIALLRPSIPSRALHTTRPALLAASPLRFKDSDVSNEQSAIQDTLSQEKVKGKTGGGEKLDSSAKGAPPQPKITNMSVGKEEELTKEQKEEVDKHNREFEKKHDRGTRALDE